MKKTIFCAIAISLIFSSCNGSNDEQNDLKNVPTKIKGQTTEMMPVMDRRVVSYKRGFHCLKGGFIVGRDTLELLFPQVFGKEQAESKCNYFAIEFTAITSTLFNYWILSPNMILYKIEPGNKECFVTDTMACHSMLVCDDTIEGNLKDKIDLGSIQPYTDEDWDCGKERKNVFF